MTTHADNAAALFAALVGVPGEPGAWLQIDQERINRFADVTEDHQFIHVDPEACASSSPWSMPIAHGFLTLSLLTALSTSLPQDPRVLEGMVRGVNYGFDKVRFLSPVRVMRRIRAVGMITDVRRADATTLQVTRAITVEIEGEVKPALVADWVTRQVYG